MAKFIECHSGNQKILINLDTVEKVYCTDSGKALITLSAFHTAVQGPTKILTDESYTEIRGKVADATGGLPMGRGPKYG